MEFALIASLLIVLVFGIIEFGRAYSQYEVYLNAAREGARKGAVRAEQSDIRDAVVNSAAGYPVDRNAISITVDKANAGDPPCSDDSVGDDVKVSWDQEFSVQIPFLPDFSPTVNIRGVFRCE